MVEDRRSNGGQRELNTFATHVGAPGREYRIRTRCDLKKRCEVSGVCHHKTLCRTYLFELSEQSFAAA